MKFKPVNMADDNLLVDISDALSERDRVRFTVHTRTKLPQFSKSVLSVVRQHEEFIWLHDCLVENDQYAGYIIPPAPPKPDFDASREKLQRLGDCEANLTKEEFIKMKQELEAEYLALFKKTVAMHEIFLQRLASHEKFREDTNFKIFLEYENELAVRGKSKRELITDSIQNIGKSLTDFVITTSQVANSNSIGNLASGNNTFYNRNTGNINNDHNSHDDTTPRLDISHTTNAQEHAASADSSTLIAGITNNNSTSNNNGNDHPDVYAEVDEQFFERERLSLALYYNSIRETAICSDRLTQAHKLVANNYLNLARNLVKLASIEITPITTETKDLSSFVACTLPSLTIPDKGILTPSSFNASHSSIGMNPSQSSFSAENITSTSIASTSNQRLELHKDTREPIITGQNNLKTIPGSDLPINEGASSSKDADAASSGFQTNDKMRSDNSITANSSGKSTGGCANEHTSEGLKKLLLYVSDCFEQAKKVEARIASDEDLKLTDTLLYYKRDTVAAQELLARRMRFMSEYESATKNLVKSQAKGGRTALQYAEVIQKQAKENFVSISALAKQELADYKKRRVSAFKKAFRDLAELEVKHLRSHSQLVVNCLNICYGKSVPVSATSPTATSASASAPQPKSQPPSLPPSPSSNLSQVTAPEAQASASAAAGSSVKVASQQE